MKGKLSDIAYARSGDKGNSANIGVIAYSEEGYRYLQENLTEKKIQDYFCKLGVTKTMRYPMPNILAINFVLENILQGGGSKSLRSDAQGKALAAELLEMPIDIPLNLLSKGELS